MVVGHLLMQCQLKLQLRLHVICARLEGDSHPIHEEVVELDRVGVTMLLLQILLTVGTNIRSAAAMDRD